MPTMTQNRYEVKTFPTYLQIVDSEDGLVVFRSGSPREVAAELRRLGAEPTNFLWELETAKRYCEAPPIAPLGYVRVHIRLEACDKNIDRVRALYREIKGRELDESRDGFYRYPAGPRNASSGHEKKFGHRIEYRAKFYTADGKVVQCDRMEVVLNLLYAGHDLGDNDLVQ